VTTVRETRSPDFRIRLTTWGRFDKSVSDIFYARKKLNSGLLKFKKVYSFLVPAHTFKTLHSLCLTEKWWQHVLGWNFVYIQGLGQIFVRNFLAETEFNRIGPSRGWPGGRPRCWSATNRICRWRNGSGRFNKTPVHTFFVDIQITNRQNVLYSHNLNNATEPAFMYLLYLTVSLLCKKHHLLLSWSTSIDFKWVCYVRWFKAKKSKSKIISTHEHPTYYHTLNFPGHSALIPFICMHFPSFLFPSLA
jgi:hypothetical protein